MEDIISFPGGLIIGAISSWWISSHFYKKSSKEKPEWLESIEAEILEKYPKRMPSKVELIALFQEHLDEGIAVINEPTGLVACPECGNSAANFNETLHTVDDYTSIIEVECPNCGYKTYGE